MVSDLYSTPKIATDAKSGNPIVQNNKTVISDIVSFFQDE